MSYAEDLTPEERSRLIPGIPMMVVHAGSVAHGTHVEPSDGGIDDVDIIGVYADPLASYFGLSGGVMRGSHVQIGKWDCSSYELRHFVKLALACNPNVICALWAYDHHYLIRNGYADVLIRNRSLFSSKLAYNTFSGYAAAQLARMTAYADNREASCCPGLEFHSEDCQASKRRGRGSRKKFATGYMGEKRKALVEKFGFDCKNAAHLIRLLRMGREFLTTGVLNVRRHDARELIEIKTGKWSLERVLEESKRLEEGIAFARDVSPLPDSPNVGAVERMLLEIMSNLFNGEVAIRSNMYSERLTFFQDYMGKATVDNPSFLTEKKELGCGPARSGV